MAVEWGNRYVQFGIGIKEALLLETSFLLDVLLLPWVLGVL